MDKSAENQQIFSTFAGLWLFGLIYNGVVDWLEEEMLDDDSTADLVVVGTVVTLLPLYRIVGARRWWIVFGAFASSGSSMWLGSKWRFRRRKRQELAGLH